MEWYVPITMIPGVALLVLSTSNFIVALANEIQNLQEKQKTSNTIIQLKISQLGLLSRAIVSLYVSIAFFTLSGISLGLFKIDERRSQIMSDFALGLGMIALFGGMALLIVYALRAVRIRKDQFESGT